MTPVELVCFHQAGGGSASFHPLRRPHVLLGHSMGALLAYSLAQQRISHGLCAPEAVIVACYGARVVEDVALERR